LISLSRHSFPGEKHGPWWRGAGAIKMRRIEKLPLRERYSCWTPREAVLAFVRLVSEDALAAEIARVG
jgi:hypothetical protein